MNILVLNEFNDINEINITHFSLDKGHFLAKSLAKLNHNVFFMTTKNDYVENDIKYIKINNITNDFIDSIDYVIITREPMFIPLIMTIPAIKNKISLPKNLRLKPKFIVKSDWPMWFRKKAIVSSMLTLFGVNGKKNTKKWICDHIDFICAQNNEMANIASKAKIPSSSIIISDMAISNQQIDLRKLINPYDINHLYCVINAYDLRDGKALWPYYYANNKNKQAETNNKKYIIVYTGRIKTDNGKIMLNMKNIMELLGNQFELHIFPGTFIDPIQNKTHSGKNTISLDLIRNTIFKDSKNIFIHYPYQHNDKYRYLCFADCGIDFSDTRPVCNRACAGHAKILEYCEMGLPVVCEENIQNLFLVKNGKNGIILPFMASDQEYADAIKKIVTPEKNDVHFLSGISPQGVTPEKNDVHFLSGISPQGVTMPIDREYCRNITIENENWDNRAVALLRDLENK